MLWFATFVTRQAGVGDVIQYTMAQPSLGSHYVEFSIVLGAIIAIGVVLFNITQSKLPAIHRSSPIMIPIFYRSIYTNWCFSYVFS